MVTNTSRFKLGLVAADFISCIVLSIWFRKGCNTCAYGKENFSGSGCGSVKLVLRKIQLALRKKACFKLQNG
ncbi:hypothetical protein AAZX31_05G000700 [Glycine max]